MVRLQFSFSAKVVDKSDHPLVRYAIESDDHRRSRSSPLDMGIKGVQGWERSVDIAQLYNKQSKILTPSTMQLSVQQQHLYWTLFICVGTTISAVLGKFVLLWDYFNNVSAILKDNIARAAMCKFGFTHCCSIC